MFRGLIQLSTELAVTIGLLSYSIYLWHYPIFAFGRIYHFEVGLLDYIAWLVLTFVLSYISYNFIEQPFRSNKIIKTYSFYAIICTSFIFTCIFAYTVITNYGYPTRFSELKIAYGKNEIDNNILKLRSHSILNSKSYQDYIKTKYDSKQRVLIVGDSHGKDLLNAFYQNNELFNKYIFEHYGYVGKKDDTKNLLSSSQLENADYVLLSIRYTDKPHLIKQLPSIIKALKKVKKKVIICSTNIEFNPIGKRQLFDHYLHSQIQKKQEINIDTLNNIFYKNRNLNILAINKRIKKIAQKEKINFLNKANLVCPDLTCKGITPDGYKTYFDDNHWTLEGAKYFGSKIKLVQIFE